MDGFESNINVVVIAATNRPEALDPALCRPGRFSRKVYVGEPDEEGRKKILAIHLRGVPLEEDLGLICNLVASLTQGLVGADLANIVNESALLAARRGSINLVTLNVPFEQFLFIYFWGCLLLFMFHLNILPSLFFWIFPYDFIVTSVLA